MAVITPVTAVPAAGTKPTDGSLGGKVYTEQVSLSAIEVTGTCNAGSGQAYVLFFLPEASAWYRLRCDGSGGGFQVDSSKNGGQIHVTFAVPQREITSFMVLLPGGATVSELFINGRSL